MYKVVIIDDEEIIVNGLKRIVDWTKFNCEVVGVAYDAMTGAQEIRRLKPDILFTDIRMHEENGLAMLAGLRSEFPDMQVTVLSGYDNFEYAKEAMRLGVRRYLSKPSKMNELEESIEFMVSKLGQHVVEQVVDDHDEIKDESVGETNSFIVKNAIEYMEKHYEEKITLSDVAEHVYISQWHLSKLMNKHSKKTFYEILNNIRIRKAKTLLRDPKLRISDIGHMVGYSDAAHFSKIFKKETGFSANKYRSQLTADDKEK